MKTYLSIDLDFWNFRPLSECEKILQYAKAKAKRKGLNIKIVEEHHGIINDINATDCKRVVNIDYHSDIVNPEGFSGNIPLNCGTWGNFVKKSSRQEFIWVHPSSIPIKEGYCHFPLSRKCNPFFNPELAGWKVCKKMPVSTRNFPWNLWHDIVGIGFCTSYDYLHCYKAIRMLSVVGKIFGEDTVEDLMEETCMMECYKEDVRKIMEKETE